MDGHQPRLSRLPLTFHLWSSLRRLALGFGLALALGAPLGLWLGRNAAARAVAYPAIEIVRPLPPLGYYTIIVLWFSIQTSKVVLLFLAALAPVVLSTIDAAAQTPNNWVRASRSVGMSTGQLYDSVSPAAAGISPASHILDSASPSRRWWPRKWPRPTRASAGLCSMPVATCATT